MTMPQVDPYIYSGTNVLKNKFGFRSQDELDKAESDFTVLKLAEIAESPLPGNYDLAHLCEMHKYVFNDLFAWAGEIRTINIEKPEPALAGLSVEYSDYNLIEPELIKLMADMRTSDWSAIGLNDKVKLFSDQISRLWKIHPFREGNTRIITHFYCQYFDNRNDQIDRKLFEQNAKFFRTALVAANAVFEGIGDKSDKSHLHKIVREALN